MQFVENGPVFTADRVERFFDVNFFKIFVDYGREKSFDLTEW